MTREQLVLALAGIQKLKKQVEKNELLLNARIQKYLFRNENVEELKRALLGFRKLNRRVARLKFRIHVAYRNYSYPHQEAVSLWLWRVDHGRQTERTRTLSQLDGEWS